MTDESDCSGPGRCHGCMKWCDRCGDVSMTCDSDTEPHDRGGAKCNEHRCDQCCALLTREDHESHDGEWKPWCLPCRLKCPRCSVPVTVTYGYCAGCVRTSMIEQREENLVFYVTHGYEDLARKMADEIAELQARPL